MAEGRGKTHRADLGPTWSLSRKTGSLPMRGSCASLSETCRGTAPPSCHRLTGNPKGIAAESDENTTARGPRATTGLRHDRLSPSRPRRPSKPEAPVASSPPPPLRLLPAGAPAAGWDSHPLEIAASARTTNLLILRELSWHRRRDLNP